MPRVARIVAQGYPHHVVQRGNNRQDVFFTDDDRRLYLAIVAEQARRRDVRVWGYCLMTNHVQVIAAPADENGLAAAIEETGGMAGRDGASRRGPEFAGGLATSVSGEWNACVIKPGAPWMGRLFPRGCRNAVKKEEKHKPRFLLFAVEKGHDGLFRHAVTTDLAFSVNGAD